MVGAGVGIFVSINFSWSVVILVSCVYKSPSSIWMLIFISVTLVCTVFCSALLKANFLSTDTRVVAVMMSFVALCMVVIMFATSFLALSECIFLLYLESPSVCADSLLSDPEVNPAFRLSLLLSLDLSSFCFGVNGSLCLFLDSESPSDGILSFVGPYFEKVCRKSFREKINKSVSVCPNVRGGKKFVEWARGIKKGLVLTRTVRTNLLRSVHYTVSVFVSQNRIKVSLSLLTVTILNLICVYSRLRARPVV